MKIAIAATVHKKISLDSLGGTEVLTYYLTEELVRRGHQVTLFATSDSKTKAKLVSVVDSQTANLKDGPQELFLPYQLMLSKKIIEQSENFDIIHNNYFETYLFSPFSHFTQCPVVHTIHNDFFHFPKLKEVMLKINNQDCFVFVSRHAFKAAEEVKNKICIYNGIDVSLFPFNKNPADYFVWLGRLTHKKGAKEAIEASQKAGVVLKVAGAIDTMVKQEYFQKEIRPLIDDKIIFVGELDFAKKIELLKNAKGLLAPIKWDEPFGLVMVEALACGTPVIAFARGAVPEIVMDRVTGYLVKEDDIEGLAQALKKVDYLNREDCRRHVEVNFTAKKMVDGYEKLYREITGDWKI